MTDISYIIVDGTTYSIVDLNAVPQIRTINNKSLDQNITLNYSDVGVIAISNVEIDQVINS